MIVALVPILMVTANATEANELAKKVSIRRTAYGVPHIKGETLKAVAFGFGNCQAEDHLWNEGAVMGFELAIWDLDDDPAGNVRHIAEHDITKEEVEEVLENPAGLEKSRSSGRPIAFGETSTGRIIAVVYEEINEGTVYPITAYEVKS